jgi:hypothetical protein
VKPTSRRGKFNNRRTRYRDRIYDSAKEAAHAAMLDRQVRAGVVARWSPQVRFPVVINGKKCCDYVCDFVVDYADGRQEVVDVKGFRTSIYRLKKKIVEAIYEVKILEV